MAKIDEAAIRRHLVAERDRLISDIYERMEGAEAVVAMAPISDSGGMASDQADDADAASDAERNQAIVRNSQLLLAQVKAALQRLDAGTYGKCVNCGKDINPRRLEALPYATLCIDCQAAAEK